MAIRDETDPSGTLDSQAADFDAFWSASRNEPVYVILGVQGSGTNLLRSILVRAFNFAVVQDQSFVFNAALAVGSPASPASLQRQFAAIRARLFPTALTRKTRRRIKSNASFAGVDDAFARAGVASASDLARFVYLYAAYSRGSTLAAIKSDDLWESIDHIDTVLPDRRIILLTRDFRDNLLSISKKDFGPVEPLVAAYYVKRRFAYYDREYRRTPAEHRIHVSYEQLLEAPDAFVARFHEHFGLGRTRPLPPPVDTGRIRRHNTRKWAALSARQLALCEAVLRNEMEAYGYAAACPPADLPRSTELLLARARDAAWRLPQKVGRIVTRLRS